MLITYNAKLSFSYSSSNFHSASYTEALDILAILTHFYL